MKILVDANILIRTANPVDHEHQTSIDALRELAASGHELILVPQVLYEYWVVATRPLASNGLGMIASEADADLTKFCTRFEIVPDVGPIFETWRELVAKYAVTGKKAHDARLVAAMIRHGVTHLLTFNGQDFTRFVEISILAPADAQAFPPADA